jgi:hypothetical protein
MQIHRLTAGENVVDVLTVESLNDLLEPLEGIHAYFLLVLNRREAKLRRDGSEVSMAHPPSSPVAKGRHRGTTSSLNRIIDRAIQVHGALGYSLDTPLGSLAGASGRDH